MILFKELKDGDRFWWKGTVMVKLTPVPTGRVGSVYRCARAMDRKEAFDLPDEEELEIGGDLWDPSLVAAKSDVPLVASETDSLAERVVIREAMLAKSSKLVTP